MFLSPAASCRTKHIEVHYHYVRDHVKRTRFVRSGSHRKRTRMMTSPSGYRNLDIRSARPLWGCPYKRPRHSISVQFLPDFVLQALCNSPASVPALPPSGSSLRVTRVPLPTTYISCSLFHYFLPNKHCMKLAISSLGAI